MAFFCSFERRNSLTLVLSKQWTLLSFRSGFQIFSLYYMKFLQCKILFPLNLFSLSEKLWVMIIFTYSLLILCLHDITKELLWWAFNNIEKNRFFLDLKIHSTLKLFSSFCFCSLFFQTFSVSKQIFSALKVLNPFPVYVSEYFLCAFWRLSFLSAVIFWRLGWIF